MLIPKVNDTEYPIIYRKIVMDVPHKSEIEIWSEICIEDNEIKEVIVFNDKKRIVVEKRIRTNYGKTEDQFRKRSFE